LAHTRYLCKRLRTRLSAAKIIVGRWGQKGSVEQAQEQLREAGADLVATTLLETEAQLNGWLPVLVHEETKEQKGGGRVAVGQTEPGDAIRHTLTAQSGS
jgi:hypothetical protein